MGEQMKKLTADLELAEKDAKRRQQSSNGSEKEVVTEVTVVGDKDAKKELAKNLKVEEELRAALAKMQQAMDEQRKEHAQELKEVRKNLKDAQGAVVMEDGGKNKKGGKGPTEE